MRVYLDNAASSPLHPKALEAMLPYLGNQYGNPSSSHSFGRKQKAAIENVRHAIAAHLGAKSNEIFFCASGTEANNMALKLAVADLNVSRIITSPVEHKCVLNTVKYLAEERGVDMQFVKVNGLGQVDLKDLSQLLRSSDQVTLVSIMHIQNELGSINDIEAIGAICEENHAFFHSDTVQSVGHFPLDVYKSKLSFLSASAHKFNGPLGVGFMFKKNDISLSSWLHGGGHERNLRSGTENVAGIVGMGKALDIAYQNLTKDNQQISQLKSLLKKGLSEISEELIFNENEGEASFTILSCSIPHRLISDTFSIELDMAGIAVSAGSACSSGAPITSSVVDNLKLNPGYSTIRISFSIFTTKEEIEYCLNFFKKELGKLQQLMH